MLDYTKISFNELDDTGKPLQAFYNYDLKESEIDNFLEEYVTVEEVPEGVSIQKVELCLTIYARHDFKLEACCTDTENNQYWVELNAQFTNADEYIQMIPDYGKISFNEGDNMKYAVISYWVGESGDTGLWLYNTEKEAIEAMNRLWEKSYNLALEEDENFDKNNSYHEEYLGVVAWKDEFFRYFEVVKQNKKEEVI